MNPAQGSDPSDDDRDSLLIGWLKPIRASQPRDTMISRIAPWRHQFVKAIALGYSWAQLAKEVAPKPEIGVQTTAGNLRKCVRIAFERAHETMPRGVGGRPRRKRRKATASASHSPELDPRSK